MRGVYCQTMTDLINQNNRIVVVDADLMNSVDTMSFGKTHPERTVNYNIREANMVDAAADVSAVGMVPYCHTFGYFAARRCLDRISVSTVFAKANIRIVSSDPGITAAMNGTTRTPFEDMGSLRDTPGVTIIKPADSTVPNDVIHQLERANGVRYARLSRKNVVRICQPDSIFEVRKAAELRPGTDVTLMATGVCVAEVLKAADQLTQGGINVTVVNVFTPKPTDRDAVERYARFTDAIVMTENHGIYNDPSNAVAEVMTEVCPALLERVGILGRSDQMGMVDYLREIYQLDAKTTYEKAREVTARRSQ